MKLKITVAALAVLICSLIGGCGGGSGSTGACVRGSGATATCGNDFTVDQCVLINGDQFYEGKSCKDIGF